MKDRKFNMSEKAELQVKSFIRGYHEYMDTWVPIIEDEYELKREPGNKKDPMPWQLCVQVHVVDLVRKIKWEMTMKF